MSSSLAVTSSANLSDTAGSLSVSWINATSGTNWRIQARILVRGVQVGSRDITAIGSGSTTVTYTASSVYAAAEGQSLSGAIVVQVVNYENVTDGLSYVRNSSAGNLTINARISNFTLTSPTTSAPIDMDVADPVNVSGSWTRPHTAFRARIKLYVGNASGGASTSWTLISNRYGFGTTVGYDVKELGLESAIVSAMNSASPKDIKVEAITQFRDGSTSNIDLGSALSRTANSGVIKNFFSTSTVTSTVALNIHLNQTLNVTISSSNSAYSHRANLQFLTSGGVWTTLLTNNMASGATSTTFTLTQANVNSVCSNYTTTTTLTDKIRVLLETFSGANQTGTTGSTSKVGSGTITNCAPTWTSTTVYVEDVGGIIRTLTGGTSYLTTLLQNKSTATVTFGGVQTLKYATPVSYSIGFGTPVTKASSGGTAGSNGTYTESGITQALTAAQLNYSSNQTVNITIVDSRGLSATQSITFTILPYSKPNLQSFKFYRSGGGYTTDLRLDFTYDIQSIVVGGVERNTADNDDAQFRVGTGGTWTNITATAGTTSGGRITYTRTNIAVTTLALGSTQSFFLRYRDDVETTHVTTSAYEVGKAIPTFQITEDNIYINGSPMATALASYPVGAIYLSTVSTSPATLFGGTWAALGAGTFLVAQGTGYAAGSTGGSATHVHTTPSHTHTVADHTHSIPSHTHSTPDHTHSLSQNGYAQVNVTGIGGSFVYLRGRSRTAWTPTDRVTASSYVGNTTSQSWGADLAGSTDSGGAGTSGAWSGTSGGSGVITTSSNNGGNTGSASNLPPYLAVYMWQRTA